MATTAHSTDSDLQETPASPAGPIAEDVALAQAPCVPGPPLVQTLRFVARPLAFNLPPARDFGDVFRVRIAGRDTEYFQTRHPDHVKALFTARPEDAPSVTGESALRPILGPDSVLTAIGPRHMRQRRLLLPPFHGDAIQRYEQVIVDAIARELDGWRAGQSFALAPRMSAVTLDVIMAGVFGIDGRPAEGSPEHELRHTIRRLLAFSTQRLWQPVDLLNMGREEPRGPLKPVMRLVDRRVYAVIGERRRRGTDESRADIMSLLMAAHDEAGVELTDSELRDQLLSLVLAGHETTANQLAWTFERLVRTPEAYAALRDAVRNGEDGDRYVEATVHESMRVRPVIPLVGRAVQQRWRLGPYAVPKGSVVTANIVALHHRADIYPDPLRFDPGRFLARAPGTYTWIPFGGGIRRCLGAALAMAEQRIVLTAIARHTDLAYTTSKPEHGRARNVTMIPSRGGRVRVLAVR
jgi:cytochrome P450